MKRKRKSRNNNNYNNGGTGTPVLHMMNHNDNGTNQNDEIDDCMAEFDAAMMNDNDDDVEDDDEHNHDDDHNNTPNGTALLLPRIRLDQDDPLRQLWNPNVAMNHECIHEGRRKRSRIIQPPFTSTMLPNLTLEITRNSQTCKLSSYLLTTVADALKYQNDAANISSSNNNNNKNRMQQHKQLRMPAFERWLLDCKLEERLRMASKTNHHNGGYVDPVLPMMNHGLDENDTNGCSDATKRLVAEIVEVGVPTKRARQICYELCTQCKRAVRYLRELASQMSMAGRHYRIELVKEEEKKKKKRLKKIIMTIPADFALFEMVPKVESMFSVDDDMANLFDFVQGGGAAAANEALEGHIHHQLSVDGGSREMDEKLMTNNDVSEEQSFEPQEVDGEANDDTSVRSDGTEEKVQVSKKSQGFDVDKTPPRRNISSEKKAEMLQSEEHDVLDASKSDGTLSNEDDDVNAGGSDLLFVGSDLKTDSNCPSSYVTNEYSEEESDNDEAAHWWNDDDTDCSVHTDEEDDMGAKLQSPSRNQTLISTAARGRRLIVDSQSVSFKRSFPRLPPPEALESTEKLLFTISRKYTFEKVSWFQPPPHLEELIKSANDDSIARRSNACGVLKIMSSKKENHFSLARTA
eukprot:CAMPEP_0196820760 /NCGR_PEP_ID=MMETSP1362-20130617/76595_1 /TAXON_ID=163516 /ORGANISM="Leptocylindrus danicus, Strain CCMP1856" /LENGTH=633 /DNA_ID=CAMNT_0042199757 /DNA_START=129 /DNA_END=2025 /DNA_ORIENTATION=+